MRDFGRNSARGRADVSTSTRLQRGFHRDNDVTQGYIGVNGYDIAKAEKLDAQWASSTMSAKISDCE